MAPDDGLQVDLGGVEPDTYGAVLPYLTGAKAHNITLRELAEVVVASLYNGSDRPRKQVTYGVIRAMGALASHHHRPSH
ncbi:MAG: hypothetical protein ACO1SX_22040 [Actinomycetota bacterium]